MARADSRVLRVIFADLQLQNAFDALKSGRFEEKRLAGELDEAVQELKKNPFAYVLVPRALWPKRYIQKYGINNLRKIDLSGGWRLTYTIRGNEIEIVSVLLEWMSHKEYEKRFGYHKN